MTAELAPETTVDRQSSQGHRPGYCSIHPNQRLVSRRAAGIRVYGWTAGPDVVCVMCQGTAEDPLEAFRCRWCGGRLYEPSTRTWGQNERREFCGHRCRQRANRAAYVLGSRGEHVRAKR